MFNCVSVLVVIKPAVVFVLVNSPTKVVVSVVVVPTVSVLDVVLLATKVVDVAVEDEGVLVWVTAEKEVSSAKDFVCVRLVNAKLLVVVGVELVKVVVEKAGEVEEVSDDEKSLV